MLGGSAVHFALAASFFTEVRVVGPVGDDFGDEHLAVLSERGIDVDDIEHVPGRKTFFWRGHYDHDMNVAHTDETELNVFADFEPKLSPASCEAQMLFLGNIQPDLQRGVRAQSSASFAALDSMNLWIDTARDSLVAAIGEVDCLLLNDAELRMLTERPNLAQAARATMELGPVGGRRQARRVRRRRCSRPTAPSRSPACPSRRSATRPAPATASRAASSATSTACAPAASTTRPRCAGRWPTGR